MALQAGSGLDLDRAAVSADNAAGKVEPEGGRVNSYLNRARTITDVVSAYRMFEDILADFVAMQVLPFDDAAGSQFEALRRQRVRIGTMDLRIASSPWPAVSGFDAESRGLRAGARTGREDWTRS